MHRNLKPIKEWLPGREWKNKTRSMARCSVYQWQILAMHLCIGIASITNSQVSLEQIVSRRMVQLDDDVMDGFLNQTKRT